MLGANTFSIAIADPFGILPGLYVLGKTQVESEGQRFCRLLCDDLFTYCVTAFQLALAYPSETGGVAASMVKFLGVFAPTQLPLAVIEGLLSVVIVIALEILCDA